MLLLLESGKVIVYNGVLGDFLWPSGIDHFVSNISCTGQFKDTPVEYIETLQIL